MRTCLLNQWKGQYFLFMLLLIWTEFSADETEQKQTGVSPDEARQCLGAVADHGEAEAGLFGTSSTLESIDARRASIRE